MKHRFGPSLYFANDKVIFDSLNQHLVNIDQIRELLNERGILVSPDTPKEDLAKYFSRLTADYFDHETIAGKLGRVAKRERITATEIAGNFEEKDIIAALDELKARIEENGDKVHITVKDGKIDALISYEHIDYTKIDMRQVEPRDGVIEFTKSVDGKYILRSTQNNEIDPIVESVISTLEVNVGAPLERSRVNLESIVDPVLRTKFFEILIKGIDKHKFVTVTEAYCFKPKVMESATSDDEESTSEEIEKLPYVEKVSLRGEGVNRSFVMKELYSRGYYIVKVVWRLQEIGKVNSDIFELEAQFSNVEKCVGFSYKARTAIILEDGVMTKKRRSPKRDEEDNFYHLIERAAKNALAELSVEIEGAAKNTPVEPSVEEDSENA